MLLNLDFANSTILSCFFLCFLIIDLHFLIPAATTKNFNSIVEPIIPIEMPSKEVKAKIEIHLVIVE